MKRTKAAAKKKDQLKELTPIQERAIQLYVGGAKITEIAKQCEIDRSTFYEWLKLPRVQAMLNQLLDDIKTNQRNKLYSLYDKALETVEKSLCSPNGSIAFKAATYIIDHVNNISTGKTDYKEIIKEQIRSDIQADSLNQLDFFGDDEFEKRCKELGVS